MKVLESNKKQYKMFCTNIVIKYEVKNSNGGLLGGFKNEESAIEFAKKEQERYLKGRLNKDLIVSVYKLKESN